MFELDYSAGVLAVCRQGNASFPLVAMLLLAQMALIVMLTEAVSFVGKQRITSIVNWLRSSVAPSALHKKQKDLRKQVLQTKADLQATSSQDQFARWAKLRRKLDKEVADLETLNGSITNQKAGAQTMVTAILFVLTTAAPFVYTSVHSKSAVFYPPRGWFGPFERFLSLPFGPAGAVSCATWMMACRRTLKLIGRAVHELMAYQSVPAAPQAAHLPGAGAKVAS